MGLWSFSKLVLHKNEKMKLAIKVSELTVDSNKIFLILLKLEHK